MPVKVDSYVKDGKERNVTRHLRFIDSFRFMRSGLASLTGNLERSQLRVLGSLYSGGKLELLLRKGVYPYDYVGSRAKLDDTCLPPKEAFYSKLNESEVAGEDYAHAEAVWQEFGCRTMRYYHDLYLKTDALLLAAVFGNLRHVCHETYKLHPAR